LERPSGIEYGLRGLAAVGFAVGALCLGVGAKEGVEGLASHRAADHASQQGELHVALERYDESADHYASGFILAVGFGVAGVTGAVAGGEAKRLRARRNPPAN
jgi:hypothetical protein